MTVMSMRLLLVLAVLWASANALADEAEVDFHIEAQDLGTALNEFALQSGNEILFAEEEISGKTTPGIWGRYDRLAALELLLGDIQVSYRINELDTVLVGNVSVSNGERSMTTSNPSKPEQARPSKNRFIAALAAVFIAAPAATIAVAQEEPQEQRLIEEIIVTAEKRQENILKVPLTMTAFTSDMIEALGMTNALDLEQLVPGLQFGSASLQQRSDGQGTTIRGIGTQSARELHSDLAVAVYVDGVYTVDTYGLAPNLFDIERVEVARGPQGTLNGRNSIAGSISFHSKRPTDTWDTDVLAEFTVRESRPRVWSLIIGFVQPPSITEGSLPGHGWVTHPDNVVRVKYGPPSDADKPGAGPWCVNLAEVRRNRDENESSIRQV